jgi:hypothetical protein
MKIFRKQKQIVFAVEFTEDNFPGLTTDQYEDIGSSISSAVFSAIEPYGAISMVSQGQFIPSDDSGAPIRDPKPLTDAVRQMVTDMILEAAQKYYEKAK